MLRAAHHFRVLPIAVALAAIAGCGSSKPDLYVDLRSDYRPGAEVRTIETAIVDAESAAGLEEITVGLRDELVDGVRVAEFTGLRPQSLAVRVRLRARDGRLVAERLVRTQIDEDSRVVTVVITRSCEGVECPSTGDSECWGGECVPPTCSPENPMACGESMCLSDDECTADEPCVEPVCRDGVCLQEPLDERCTGSLVCVPDRGCVEPPEAMDAGSMDAGTTDAATDAGGSDAGPCVPGASCDTGRACEIGTIDCSGGSPVCVAAGLEPAGTECRAGSGTCDPAETCDGSSPLCPANEYASAGTSCSGGVCDGLGSCTSGCTPGSPCGTGNPCELGEISCASGSPECVSAGPAPAGTECRAASGACDVAEQCNGVSTTCPSDDVRSSSYVCRGATDACDAEETCNGIGKTCPTDQDAPSGTSCPGGTCDGAGNCVSSGECTDDYDCGTCEKCSDGSCVDQAAGEDTKDECTGVSDCSSTIAGWSGGDCMKFTGGTGINGDCNGSGSCATISESCTGSEVSTSCDVGCKKACPIGADAFSYNTPNEACYGDDTQHGCDPGWVCGPSGMCDKLCSSDSDCPEGSGWPCCELDTGAPCTSGDCVCSRSGYCL